jgi:DDE superfamily endonuclease
MSSHKYTGASTNVFSPSSYDESDLLLDIKQLDVKVFSSHRSFDGYESIEPDDLKRMVNHMREENGFIDIDKSHSGKANKSAGRSRRHKVNAKRAEIASFINSGAQLTYRQIARLCSCDQATVKNVSQHIHITGKHPVYEYNNLHSQRDINNLNKSIDDPSNVFYSVNQIKRLQPMFSKKRITAQLISRGKKWTQMKKVPPPNKRPVPDPVAIYNVLKHVVGGLWETNKRVLFVDEFKLPLYQTPTHCWGTRTDDDPRINSRFDRVVITAIVMCSTTGFEFVQLCLDEVTSKDFMYFMQECVARLPVDKAYTFLMDNATWHKSEMLRHSDVFRLFCFNVPGVFQLNMIENAFSGVRSDFRRRPVCDTLANEVKNIARLFGPEINGERFKGYHKNYLRSLSKYLETEEF